MGHGGMNCQIKTARVIMILINVIFFIIGAILLGEGIDFMIHPRVQSFTELISPIESSSITKSTLLSNELLCITMVIPGLILISIGFFGCSGAITQIQSLLFCYALLVGIILFFQMILFICLNNFRLKLKEQIIFFIHSVIRDTYKGPLEKNLPSTSFLSLVGDFIMYKLNCCGLESKNDFDMTNEWNRTNPWWNSTMLIEKRTFKYPLTCCSINDIFKEDSDLFNRAISCAINGSNIYEISCYKKVVDILNSFQGFILFLALIIFIIEIFTLTFVLVIYNRNQMKRITYVMERLPPTYSARTRINNANLYFQI